ncbi:hypothetical protein LZ30DRAFT_780971 [Colletotrichum cereale]|nr:hypothetical protein LZ30DRAFT_780971 [Colletotrichum cereale]
MNLRIFFVVLAQIALCWAVISKPNKSGALKHRQVGGQGCLLKGGEQNAIRLELRPRSTTQDRNANIYNL